MDPIEALKKAIELAGGPSALAKEIGTTPQNLAHWRRGRTAVPGLFALRIEIAVCGQVPAELIQPEIRDICIYYRQRDRDG